MTSNSKVLLVTGRLARDLVKKFALESGLDCEIEVLPISVASFATEGLLLKSLKRIDLERYSTILVPGLIRFDLDGVSDRIGHPVYKGPRYASDIPLVLDNLDEFDLSMKEPADKLLADKVSQRLQEELDISEEASEKLLEKPCNFIVGKNSYEVHAGKDFPTRIVAEVEDAPRLSNEEIVSTAGRYLEDGAEIIDIGMVAEREMSDEIPRIVSVLRENFEVPISIDTLNEAEIERAIDCGVDMVISLCGSTVEEFGGLDIPAVVVPTNPEKGYYPDDNEEKLDYLTDLLVRAEELGYQKIIADPIMEPVGRGFSDSLDVFYSFRKDYPDTPVFMGIGNVVELYDADSVGINALLMGFACELNATFVLTLEASDKTRGSVYEATRARNMMLLAERRNSVPKDLGLDMLELKEKRRAFDPYDETIEEYSEVVQAGSLEEDLDQDSKGFFRIFVDDSEIIAVFNPEEGSKIVIKGKNAEDICREIVKRGLISELSHAMYLGRELEKAEIALNTDRGYVQEKKLFDKDEEMNM